MLVSAVLSGDHVFVQHPLHPSHPALHALQKGMLDSYSSMDAPKLPGIEISAVCVMPINGFWYRVQICDSDADDEQRCLVKFLDFGGYMNVSFSELRQIRTDFMTLPFQATECILSNIEPIGKRIAMRCSLYYTIFTYALLLNLIVDDTWSADAADILNKLTKGIVLQAQVAGYNSHNIPEIYLFASLGPNVSIDRMTMTETARASAQPCCVREERQESKRRESAQYLLHLARVSKHLKLLSSAINASHRYRHMNIVVCSCL